MKTSIPVIVLAGWSAVAGAATPIDKRVAAASGNAVRVVNVAGAITVVGGTQPEVHVTGTVGSGVERVDILNDAGTIVVRVVLPKTTLYNRDGQATLTVTIPAGSRLETSTVSADQNVRGISGAVQLSSVSGDLEAQLGSTDAQVKTVSGDINLQGSGKSAKWRVSTVSGDVTLLRAAGSLELNTVSGDTQLELDQLTSFRGRTTSGDMQLRGRVLRGADVSYESVSGDLGIAVGTEAGMSIDASTFSGEISTCFGEKGKPTSEYSPGEKLSTRRGEGGATVRVKSLSGDVSICDHP
jgi:DUF4097 and DUF4098 domain-containing protein YvlB